MIGRILWHLAFVALALAIAGLQLDRQTQRSPALAEHVPEPFRSSSQLPLAAYALADDDHEYALEQARQLVRRRPIPAEHLRILAQAQFLAGDIEQGTLTVQYAAQRGWRDPLAQEAMLRLAVDAGDMSEAARRFAALFLRRATDDALLQEVAPWVLSEPDGDGRKMLSTIVSGGTRWHRHFLNRGARVLPPDAFAEIVSKTAAAGTRYECPILERVTGSINRRDPQAGSTLSSVIEAQCPG